MKRIFLAIMTMALTLTASAETTDITTDNNQLYIADVTASAGSQATLSVRMKNSAKVQTIGVQVKLPEGVTVATGTRGENLIALSKERTSADRHSIMKNRIGGIYRIGILGTAGMPFSNTDGEVFTMTLNIPSGMAPGDYEIELQEVELTDTDSKSYTTESVKSTLTISSMTTGIDSAATADTNAAIYGTDGTKLPAMRRGVNIIDSSNGIRKAVRK